MELGIAKKLIKKYAAGHVGFIQKAEVAERYYKKKNDILYGKGKEGEADNPLRNSDNRVPSNFYKMQVNQKAAYAFTVPPKFDVGSDSANKAVTDCLGDAFAKKCKSLCVQASNSAVGWVHYWKDGSGAFHYAVVDSKQVVPVWTDDLEKELLAAMRQYKQTDQDTGDSYIIYEFWTDRQCQAFRRKIADGLERLEPYLMYTVVDVDTGGEELTDTYIHDWGEVPFIFFNNNDELQNDLSDIKELIDSYDKVYSGFANDLEDIQELIFVLTNYGGDADDAAGILKEMKNAKVISVESDGAEDKSGVSTLAIEIPVEAREKMLSLTRKAIFEQGMAIDPDPQNFGNSSGVALKYLYSLLELKTGMVESEFRISFNRLVRAILKASGLAVGEIVQTWTRTSVTNDTELADIAQKSKGVISDETIIRNHPWVGDPEEEMKRVEGQKAGEEPQWDKVPPVKARAGEPDGEEG